MTDAEHHYQRLARMYLSAPCNAYYQPEIMIREGQAEVVIPVRSNLHHAAGAAHGSVYFKAMDDATFFAVSSVVPQVFVVTVSFNVYLTRPVVDGVIRSVGRVVHQSRRLYLAEAELFDEKGRSVGRGNGSFMPTTRALADVPGYTHPLPASGESPS